ncbi:glycosyltransferase [Lunatimonas salinarum]|uniref:glycosyltransferase n=1 Tax=Lunatimonas salinarum TaxID=1774590 RepID=UPI001ADFCB22|nr:glycosyltransferase [Lunatimonas salinarum]
MKNKALFITNMPVQHQVELFDELTKFNHKIEVIYTRFLSAGRSWEINPNSFNHKSLILKEIRIKDHWYFNYELIKVISKIIKSDIIIIGQYASFTMQIAMYVSFLLRKKLIFWSEPISGVEYEERKLISNVGLSSFFRKIALVPVKYFCQQLWAIGDNAVKSFEKLEPCGEIKKYYYYSDLSRFYNLYKNDTFDNINDKIIFLFAGSLSIRKGIDLVISANEILHNNGHNNFEVLVAGSGPLEESLKNNNNGNLKFLGFVPQKGIELLYHKCDVLLFPSRYDGWGMSLVEALASGMPVISTTKVGAAVELLNEKNGIMIEELSPKHTADSMAFFIANKSLLKNYISNCIETSKIVHVDAGVKLFNELINGGK